MKNFGPFWNLFHLKCGALLQIGVVDKRADLLWLRLIRSFNYVLNINGGILALF